MTYFSRLLQLFHVFIVVLHFRQCDVLGFIDGRSLHQYKAIDSNAITIIANMSDMSRFKDILKEFMVPRVVGTTAHANVKRYLIKEMTDLGWNVETDPFEDEAPIFGVLKFENIIARLNPDADRYLVLACHYDSKYMREGEFVGATDSAVPCAMMVDLAYALKDKLRPYKNTNLSLMLIFFDGEEAFQHWGPNDSIYGARNLARKWESSGYPRSDSETNQLNRMDLLVLLDLLGASNPVFYNYFSNSERWYRRMISAEKRLNSKSLLKGYSLNKRYFSEMSMAPHIEDDHIPFMKAGVPVLHMIPVPFPDEWHTPEDNWSILDFNTIDNLNKIIRVFVVEYLKGYNRST